MLGINIPYDIYVHTTKGVRCIRHLTPGDKLYEYGTSELLEVQEVLKSDIQTIWEIHYNDGRVSYGVGSTPILYGNQWIPLRDAAHLGKFQPIEPFVLDYHHDTIFERPTPDPFAAGALLIHGDYDDEYINLPIDRYEANNFIRYMHNSEIAEIIGNDKVYFSWKQTAGDQRITWREFFPRYRMYVTSKEGTTPMIPIEYTEASIIDRKKFVRGAFDVGYSKDKFPDQVGTANTAELRLKELQKILWSLGILSKIRYDPIMPISRGRNFRLDIIGWHENYPGFFYDIDNIRRILDNDNRIIKEPFKLKINRISKVNQGYLYEVKLNKPHAIYTTSNFLPRVSF